MIIILTGGTVAVAVPVDKAAVLSDWTQKSAGSYSRWDAGRQDQGSWAVYEFDWSTDNCSASPDAPLGFNFSLSCQRHDFGYRNYKAAGQFEATKARVDNAFLADLRRKCDTYSSVVRPACDSLAWAYYQAVKVFGVAAVSQADLDRAARIKSTRLQENAELRTATR